MNTLSATIPASAAPEVRAKVAKFNARAAKKGLPLATLHISPTVTRSVELPTGLVQVIEECEARIVAPPLTIGAYVLVARVEPLQRNGTIEPFVSTAPDQFVPEQYSIESPFTCDHCGLDRRRSETFLVRSIETGDLVQVGRQCIRDFLGHDPAAMLTYWRELDSLGSEDEWSGYSARIAPTFTPDSILRLTARVVARKGWLSQSRAGDYETPTSAYVNELAHGPAGGSEARKAWERLDAECEWNTQAEHIYQQTLDAIRALDLKPVNRLGDWEVNIVRLATADAVPARRVGFLCSAVVMGWKAVNAPVSAKVEGKRFETPPCSEGDKVEVEGVVTLAMNRETDWGAQTLLKVTVETETAKHCYIWWATGTLELSAGDLITIRGTVKRVQYDDFVKAQAATLTRCKFTVKEA